MSLSAAEPAAPQTAPSDQLASRIGRYGASLVMVGVATVLARVAGELGAARGLALIYVLPVVVAATHLGWGPSLLAVLGGALAFDFFFTQPLYSLAIDSPSDVWAAALLFVIAIMVGAVAAQGRRRGLAAARAAAQAQALQALAHLVLEGRPGGEVLAGAAATLSAIFQAPSAIYVARGGELRVAAGGGGARPGEAERAAALAALETGRHVQAEAYPFDASRYDVWPVTGRRIALAVSFGDGRPEAPERFIEPVGAYLATAFPQDERIASSAMNR